jgi:hypothetical protein
MSCQRRADLTPGARNDKARAWRILFHRRSGLLDTR